MSSVAARGWVRHRTPAWVKCEDCEDWLCRIHDMHVHDCPCPEISEWDQDPYSEGGPPEIDVEDLSTRAMGPAG